jgi:hypothetical protein
MDVERQVFPNPDIQRKLLYVLYVLKADIQIQVTISRDRHIREVLPISGFLKSHIVLLANSSL